MNKEDIAEDIIKNASQLAGLYNHLFVKTLPFLNGNNQEIERGSKISYKIQQKIKDYYSK